MNSYLTMYRRQGARIVQVCTVGNYFSRIDYIFWPAQGARREPARWRTFGILTLVQYVQSSTCTQRGLGRVYRPTVWLGLWTGFSVQPCRSLELSIIDSAHHPHHLHHPYLHITTPIHFFYYLQYSLLALRLSGGVFGELGNLRAREILEVYQNPTTFPKIH